MAERRSGDGYRPLALIAVIMLALLVFALFFLSFLAAPLLILTLFYIGFAASDRSKGRSDDHGEPAPEDFEYVPPPATEERLAREAAVRRALLGRRRPDANG